MEQKAIRPETISFFADANYKNPVQKRHSYQYLLIQRLCKIEIRPAKYNQGFLAGFCVNAEIKCRIL